MVRQDAPTAPTIWLNRWQWNKRSKKSEVNIHNLQNIIKYLGNSCKDTVKSMCAFLLKYEMSLLWKFKGKTEKKNKLSF